MVKHFHIAIIRCFFGNNIRFVIFTNFTFYIMIFAIQVYFGATPTSNRYHYPHDKKNAKSFNKSF